MSTELTTQKSNELAVPPSGSWGSENTFTSDITIPRLWLGQAMSDFVKGKKADDGDIVNSETLEVIAKFGSKLEIIPIYTIKQWEIYKVETKEEYIRTELTTPENDNLSYEDMENGQAIRRVRKLGFFVLNPKDLKGLPYLITFKKSSYPIGKRLISFFRECQKENHPPASYVFSLGAESDTNRSGDEFKVFTLEKAGRRSTPEELSTAYKWYTQLKAAQVKSTVDTDEQVPF